MGRCSVSEIELYIDLCISDLMLYTAASDHVAPSWLLSHER